MIICGIIFIVSLVYVITYTTYFNRKQKADKEKEERIESANRIKMREELRKSLIDNEEEQIRIFREYDNYLRNEKKEAEDLAYALRGIMTQETINNYADSYGSYSKYHQYQKNFTFDVDKDKEIQRTALAAQRTPSTAEEQIQSLQNLASSLKLETTPEKEKSVIGQAIAGGIIAGPAGAVVGAIHAADKNNKIRSEKK